MNEIQLVPTNMLWSQPIRRAGEVGSKSSNRPRVGRLSVRTQIADLHVLDHSLMKGRHGDLQKLTATVCPCFWNYGSQIDVAQINFFDRTRLTRSR